MRLRKHLMLVLLLVIYHQFAYGRDDSIYLHIEDDSKLTSQIKKAAQGKLVTIFTVGGFIKIYPTSTFTKSPHKLYYRVYFKEKTLHNKGTSEALKEVDLSKDADQIYLNVNREVFADILDRQTDTLVSRYKITRPSITPKISFFSQENNEEFPFRISSSGDYTGEHRLPPGKKIKINIARDTYFKNLEVEYTLVNLKTRRSEHIASRTSFEPLKLTANTDYQLRVNYVVQPQSVSTVYIHVNPYWYQSYLTYIIISIVFVVVGFLLITSVLRNKIKFSQKKQRKLEEEAIRLQSLLNPHFTFNALSSIQGLMNTDRIEEANHYLQEFSSLLRKTLTKNQHVFNSLDQELEMMRMYIRLEALRFNFSWDIEISAKLNIADIDIPTLMLQPLVENAIKHGLTGLGDKGQLVIICKEGQEKDTFVIIIKDNGIWTDKSSEAGYGLSLTAERIRTINKLKNEQRITLEFDKRLGTEAILTFHNWLSN